MNDDLQALLAGRVGPEGVDAARAGGPLEAIELVTADDEGWPHVAWLSAGEVLVTGPSSLALCLWSGSTSTRNLQRDGRALLHVVVDGEVHKIQLSARSVGPVEVGDRTFAGFTAEAVAGKRDAVGYADVLSGPRYQLHDALSVADRWDAQLVALAARVQAG